MSDTIKLVSTDGLNRFRLKLLEEIPSEAVFIGAAAPTSNDYLIWVDTTSNLMKYKNSLGGWTAIAGGGSGGSTNNAKFNVTNTSGWLSKTVAYGAACDVVLTWSSIEDEISTGNGTVSISVGGSYKTSYEVEQGKLTIDLSKYLLLGTNTVQVSISDLYGNTRTIQFTITTVQVSISSYFDSITPYANDIQFSYIPVGDISKTVHFLIDGDEVDTQIVTASNREQSYTIAALSHGSHTLEVYFTGKIDGQDVESNHLFYDIICYEEGNDTPIIACAFDTDSVKQFATVSIPYIVYTPQILTSDITITDNFGFSKTLTGVDRTVQTLAYKAESVGAVNIAITAGKTTKNIKFDVVENKIDVTAEIQNLELYLTAKGRDNNEENPEVWQYGNIAAEFTGFNFVSDGWKQDENGDTVLRVSGDSRVYIPLNIFGSDFRTTGKTIEFEFATRNVLNPNATVISCWSGERGIKITAQEALLKSEQSEVSRQYKEDEHIRVSFVIQKRAEKRLLSLYINGIESACVQYADEDDFSQSNPVGISIGSNLCTTDIYCIRVYGNNLTRYQSLDNWIADTQNVEELIERYNRNNVFDKYGNIDISKLPSTLPYLILDVASYADLPQFKGDKKKVSGRYVDPLHPERSFVFYDAEIDVQGTSSQFYSRKNYKIKFKSGFTINGVSSLTYKLRDTSMPTDTFTFKADVASSEGANNVELVMLYDEVCPVKTPPQETDNRVRQGIEGYPCLLFYSDGSSYSFLGKYNFNNDKATEEVFGLATGDESWEILTNETQMAVFKDDDFESPYYDTVAKKEKPIWTQTFEARYPEDSTDVTNLKDFVAWLKSTDTTAVYTEEEKQERIDKFKNELASWANVDALIFNYIFTETFLMVDNRAKNAFPTRYDSDGKWLILPYDYDTAIGINNEGELKFGYWLEDTDLINGTNVYNGQDSVLYVNLRLAFADEIMTMYQELRTNDAFSYEAVEKRFEEHQKAWGEAIFNEDTRFKYIEPLINDGDNTYLPMLQGSKASQRKWWLYNRFRYLDSKYVAGDNLEDYIMLRPYGVADITITPYADIYASIKFDNILVQERALRGDSETPNSYTLKNPLANGNHGVIAIYSASQLASVGDLSGLKVGMADFHMATKLNIIKLGDGAVDYENPNLNNLTIGNLALLSRLDVRNCTGLTQTVDVSGCANIEHVYCEGSAVSGVKLPNGGILKTLHLPETTTSLIIQNQPMLTDFSIPTFANISTLRLEGVDYGLFDFVAILNAIQPNSRVRLLGIEMNINTAEEIFALYDKFDTFRGLDEQGNNLDKAVISGTIHCGTITGTELAEMQSRYPNIVVEFEHITSNVYFYVDGELVHSAIVYDGGDCYDPITEGIIDTPTKAETDTTKFIFESWDNDLKHITADRNVNAVFSEHTKYVVTFMNGNSVHSQLSYITGESIVVPSDPTKESTAQYDYTFKGWSLDGSTVVDVAETMNASNLTYIAVYTSVKRSYEVIFLDYDDSVLQRLTVEYGKTPQPTAPTRDSTVSTDYIFAGWTPSLVAVTGTATYKATYTEKTREYNITWVKPDGTTTQKVAYGTVPIVPSGYEEGSTTMLDGNEFTIIGYHPSIVAVTGNAEYRSKLQGSISSHTTKFGAWYNIATRYYIDRFTDGSMADPEYASAKYIYKGSYSSPTYAYVIFYGYNFELLKTLSNVIVTNFKLSYDISHTNGTDTSVRFVKDFVTDNAEELVWASSVATFINTDAYTIVEKTASGSGGHITGDITSTDVPEVLEWINNNLLDFINGYATNTFGVRMFISGDDRDRLYYPLPLEVTFTCDY